jgi:hypothetical protein
MKNTVAIATIVIVCAAGHAIATTNDLPQTRRSPALALTPAAGQNTENVWNGKWQGTAVSGQQLVLQLQVEAQRMKGRLTVGKQSANIVEGKVVGEGFAFVTGPIDGHKVDGSGRKLGDVIELRIEGVKEPLTLTRMK